MEISETKIEIIDEQFSFQVLGSLHARLGFLFLRDSLPFLATLMGALLGRWRSRQISSFTLRVQSQTERNQEIMRFTHALIAGDLNTSFTHAEADQPLSNSLNTLRDNLETRAYAAISGLVRYLDANQGAIYIATDEETQL